MQLNLAFLEIPSPSTFVLETRDEAQRVAALEVLARLIVHAVQIEQHSEGDNDD